MKLDTVAGIEVTIRVDDQTAREYYDDEDDRSSDDTGVRYIQAASGALFSIHVATNDHRLREYNDAIRYAISIDGKRVTARNLHRFGDDGIAFGQSRGVEGVIDGQKTFAKYTFGDLETTDEPFQDVEVEDVRYLGEIKVETYLVRMASKDRPRPANALPAPFLQLHNPDILPEKALKGRAISHTATLSTPEVSQRRDFATRSYREALYVSWPYGREPFATFIFKYRSRIGDLQIEGVVPHSISPVSGTAMKQENMSPARPREIIGLNELSEWDYNSSPRQIKRDRSSSLETELYAEVTATAIRNSARNKRRARVKLTRAQQEGLIDLTGDD